jgi:hypothetical protein
MVTSLFIVEQALSSASSTTPKSLDGRRMWQAPRTPSF